MSNENYRLMAVEICHAFGSSNWCSKAKIILILALAVEICHAFGSSNVDAMASILPHMTRSERETIFDMAKTLTALQGKTENAHNV